MSRANVKDKRKAQLIAAALESIAKRGLLETTITHISKGAGMSRGIINFYFTSKEMMLRETLKTLIDEYEARLRDMVAVLSPANHKFAVEAASLPAQIRGYGHVKEASVDLVRGLEASVVERFHNAAAPETNNDDNRVALTA